MSRTKALPLLALAIGFLVVFLCVLPAALQHFGQSLSTSEALPSTVLQVVTSLWAVVLGVSFVAIQLSASFFSIRLIAFLLTRWYFWAVMVIYPATILYAAVLLALDATQYHPGMWKALLGLVGFDVILLLPYSVLFLIEVHPANRGLLDFLGRHVSARSIVADETLNLLQPINDVCFSAMRRQDTDTASACVKKLGDLYEAVLWKLCPMQRDAIWQRLPLESSIAEYFTTYGFREYAIHSVRQLSTGVVDQLARTLFGLISTIADQALQARDGDRKTEVKRCWQESLSLARCLVFLYRQTRTQDRVLESSMRRQQAYLIKVSTCLNTSFGSIPPDLSKAVSEFLERNTEAGRKNTK